MPYLHWETDRQREKFAIEIEHITESWKDENKAKEEEKKKKRREERSGLPKVKSTISYPATEGKGDCNMRKWSKPFWINDQQGVKMPSSNGFTSKSAPIRPKQSNSRLSEWLPRFREKGPPGRKLSKLEGYPTRINSMQTLIKTLGFGIKKGLPVDKNGRVISQNALGQFLIDAARLYEEMANYRDKKLLQKYLHNEVPLHPRRTLDQSYYWTLNTTKNRDRDQVVYRGTKSGKFHGYNPETGRWPDHEEQGISLENGCDECRVNIRKISRVVMVDQLWMWILDEQTIITCFPKRYGANKQETDASSVHKCIRQRLQNTRQNHIRSVFDLALVIFDECSSTLFDRAKTRDRQPQVMDAFSEAIGNLVSIQRLRYSHVAYY
jgi:hypothetical protein